MTALWQPSSSSSPTACVFQRLSIFGGGLLGLANSWTLVISGRLMNTRGLLILLVTGFTISGTGFRFSLGFALEFWIGVLWVNATGPKSRILWISRLPWNLMDSWGINPKNSRLEAPHATNSNVWAASGLDQPPQSFGRQAMPWGHFLGNSKLFLINPYFRGDSLVQYIFLVKAVRFLRNIAKKIISF